MFTFNLRFINNPGFIAKGINWVTNSLIDHAEIGPVPSIKDPNILVYIGAHAGAGIQERKLDYCIPIWERRYEVPCTEIQYNKTLAAARSKIGTKYDYKDIFGLALHLRVNDPTREICSEFVDWTAETGDLPLLNVRINYAYLVTPEILHTSLALRGHCTYRFVKGVVN